MFSEKQCCIPNDGKGVGPNITEYPVMCPKCCRPFKHNSVCNKHCNECTGTDLN